MKSRKVKKFAAGGDMQIAAYGGNPNPFSPQSGGSARQGLDMIGKGAGSINEALGSLGQSLSAASQAVGDNTGTTQPPQYGGGGTGGIFGRLGRLGIGAQAGDQTMSPGLKKGGKVKNYAKGGSVSSASKRADGIAQRGKTKGRMV